MIGRPYTQLRLLVSLLLAVVIGTLIYEIRVGASGLNWHHSIYISQNVGTVGQYAGNSNAWSKWLHVPGARLHSVAALPRASERYTCSLLFEDNTISNECVIQARRVQKLQSTFFFWQIQYQKNNHTRHEWLQVIELYAMNDSTRITFSFFWDKRTHYWFWQLDKLKSMIKYAKLNIDDFRSNVNSYHHSTGIDS